MKWGLAEPRGSGPWYIYIYIYILVKIFKIYLKDVNIGKVLLLFQDRKNKK